MESRLRTSSDQFSLMLEFMERHGDLSRPIDGPQGRQKSDQLWRELTDLLNSMGGGTAKTIEKWKKVWSDWKTKTKKKAALNNRDLHGTGGGSKKGKALNSFEERIIKIMGVASVTGDQNVEEAGIEIQNDLREASSTVNDSIEILIVSSEQQSSCPLSRNEDRALTPLQATSNATTNRTAQDGALTPIPSTSNGVFNNTAPDRSPTSINSPLRVRRPRQRRYRQGPFDRATSEFIAVEEKRLRLQQENDIRRHELDKERLKLESDRLHIEEKRVQVEAERVQVEKLKLEHDKILHETIAKLYSYLKHK